MLAPGSELQFFYHARGYRPLWVEGNALRPAAAALAARLARAGDDGLSADRYKLSQVDAALAQARTGDPAALARAELLLSQTYAAFLTSLHRPNPAAGMTYVHDGLAPKKLTARQWLEVAARAPSLERHIADATRLNPVYEELRTALAAYRARWSALPSVSVAPGPALQAGAQGPRVAALRQRLGLKPAAAAFDAPLAAAVRAFQSAHGLKPTGVADPQTVTALNTDPAYYERLIRANMERARAIPADPGRRFLLVDTASAMLRFYEGGQLRDTMRVIVGKPDQQTPIMAGRISFAVLKPYWNLPPDLAQIRARRVLAQGAGYLAKDHLEALSGWEEDARVLSPKEVDWKAVADGRQKLRMRQTPGPHNMMGDIKFMLPNKLGIYLHDTANKSHFTRAERRLSSGCVRVSDASRLARWLFNGKAPTPNGAPEQRVDLPEPVPVYITYLTVEPHADGATFRRDHYKRDPALLAALDRPPGAASAGALRD